MAVALENSSLSNTFFLFKNGGEVTLLFWRWLSFAQYLKRLHRQRQPPAPSVPPLSPAWVSKAGNRDQADEDKS